MRSHLETNASHLKTQREGGGVVERERERKGQRGRSEKREGEEKRGMMAGRKNKHMREKAS